MNSSENIRIQNLPEIIFGNDIVDISDPDSAAFSQRSLHRIFTEHELDAAEKSSYDKQNIWSIWAAKEAAYKAVASSKKIPFRWKSFEVQNDFQSVRYDGNVLSLEIEKNAGFVHAKCIAVLECNRYIPGSSMSLFGGIAERSNIKKKIHDLSISKGDSQIPVTEDSRDDFLTAEDLIFKNKINESSEVRIFSMLESAEHLGLDFWELKASVVRTGAVQPELILESGQRLRMSYSHHGKYLAFLSGLEKYD